MKGETGFFQTQGVWAPRGVGWGEVREVQEGGDSCIIMAESHRCRAETNTTL